MFGGLRVWIVGVVEGGWGFKGVRVGYLGVRGWGWFKRT